MDKEAEPRPHETVDLTEEDTSTRGAAGAEEHDGEGGKIEEEEEEEEDEGPNKAERGKAKGRSEKRARRQALVNKKQMEKSKNLKTDDNQNNIKEGEEGGGGGDDCKEAGAESQTEEKKVDAGEVCQEAGAENQIEEETGEVDEEKKEDEMSEDDEEEDNEEDDEEEDDEEEDDEEEDNEDVDDEDEEREKEDGELEGEEDFIPLGKRKDKGAELGVIGRSATPPWYRSESIARGFPLRTLHNEILDLCDLLMPTPEEKARTAIAITYVKRVVRETLGGNAKVHIFGSQLTGLVLPNSDVDTVVAGAPFNSIQNLGRAMFRRSRQEEVHDVVVIAKARVPIVKFVHAKTGVHVDVCFDQSSGLKSGAAARVLMRQMPQVRPLVMVLKAYMGQRNLNETYQGGIGSFLLQLMVVALVQKCVREARSRGLKPPTNLGFLLDEFFDFYGNQLNYNSTGITLLGQGGGGFYKKQDLGWFLPHKPHLLSVQNPHDPSIDVASNSFKVDVCRNSFQATSLRLRCAFQRAIADEKRGFGDEGARGFLKFAVHPGGTLSERVLPPPTFCTRKFDEDDEVGVKVNCDMDDAEGRLVRDVLQGKARSMMKKHGSKFSPGTPGRSKKRKAPGSKGGRGHQEASFKRKKTGKGKNKREK